MKKFLLSFFLLSAAPAYAADLKTGIDALGAGDFSTAVANLQPLAMEGNPEAEYRMCGMYYLAQGVPKNDAEAANFCKAAAQRGHADAMYNLALFYQKGEGVQQDFNEATKWYAAAASKGNPNANYNLNQIQTAVAASAKPKSLALVQNPPSNLQPAAGQPQTGVMNVASPAVTAAPPLPPVPPTPIPPTMPVAAAMQLPGPGDTAANNSDLAKYCIIAAQRGNPDPKCAKEFEPLLPPEKPAVKQAQATPQTPVAQLSAPPMPVAPVAPTPPASQLQPAVPVATSAQAQYAPQLQPIAPIKSVAQAPRPQPAPQVTAQQVLTAPIAPVAPTPPPALQVQPAPQVTAKLSGVLGENLAATKTQTTGLTPAPRPPEASIVALPPTMPPNGNVTQLASLSPAASYESTAQVQDLKWYVAQADTGNAQAQNNLGVLYRRGLSGAPHDPKQAVVWFQRAASQGSTNAMINLASMYKQGEGVPQNFELAFAWYNLAANRLVVNSPKRNRAQENAQQIMQYLSQEQVGEAMQYTGKLDSSIPLMNDLAQPGVEDGESEKS